MAEWHGGAPEMVRFESFAQAQAERDHYKANLEALRGGVEAEIAEHRRWAEGDRQVRAHLLNLDKAGEAEAYDAQEKTHDLAADRLQSLLSGSTKPSPSLDPAGEEGTGG